MSTNEYSTYSGPWIPCLRTGEKNYTFTPQELSELLNKAFADGYEYAKSIYYTPEVATSSLDVIKETEHGTH